MDVYRGIEKVAGLDSYNELRVGANRPAFIYEGGELVYPSPVSDGLVLWYDFSGRTNSDGQRDVAEDLSGNGNHGTLQNFNYVSESGYNKNKLTFDGVDDFTTTASASDWVDTGKITAEVTFKTNFTDRQQFIFSKDYENFDVAILSNGGLKTWYSNGNRSNYRQPATSGEFNDGDIHVVTIVFHKDTDTVVYYDSGVEVYRYTNNNPLDMTGFSEKPFELGRRVGGRDPFVGDIYSTKIYNRALSPEEIAHNYAIEKERFNL